jgi:hypothetical protein
VGLVLPWAVVWSSLWLSLERTNEFQLFLLTAVSIASESVASSFCHHCETRETLTMNGGAGSPPGTAIAFGVGVTGAGGGGASVAIVM